MPFNFQSPQDFGSGLAQGAEEGFQNFVVPQFKDKLALQMMSKKMEMENQSKLSLERQSMQQNMVPNDEMQTISKYMSDGINAARSGSDVPAIDLTKFSTPQGKQMAFKAMMEMAAGASQALKNNKPMLITDVDQYGNKRTMAVDPHTGQPRFTVENGLGQQGQKDIAAGRQAYYNMQKLTGTIGSQLKNTISSDNGLSALFQRGELTLNQLSQANPQAKAFLDQLPFTTLSLEKGAFGSIPRNEKTIAALRNTVFNPGDTVQTAMLKLHNLNKIGYDAALSAYETHGMKDKMPLDIHNPDAELGMGMALSGSDGQPVAPPAISPEEFMAMRKGKGAK